MLQGVCLHVCVLQEPRVFAFIHCVIEHPLSTDCVLSPCLAWV